MSYRIEDVVHENGRSWVLRKGPGWFEVYTTGITHSTRCGTFHFSARPGYALERAIEHAAKLATHN
ncbi:hypothetical protein [Lysobacter sp. CA199]|uniref:hypothetical protein n=1 Tax=Lysobacter sp. CA199 TaxID=3455608 RepID=UPI003F8CFDE8